MLYRSRRWATAVRRSAIPALFQSSRMGGDSEGSCLGKCCCGKTRRRLVGPYFSVIALGNQSKRDRSVAGCQPVLLDITKQNT